MKIMKIYEIQMRITKIMKIKEINKITIQTMKNIGIQYMLTKNLENPRNRFENEKI